HWTGQVHNNADALSQRQEPMKERLEAEKFKKKKGKELQKDGKQTDLEWHLNFAEYDIYKDEDHNNNKDKEEIISESDQEYIWIRSKSKEHVIKELNEIHNCYYLEV
ncbi:12012_t:CDS:2, partial [Cetraspora pellucida]